MKRMPKKIESNEMGVQKIQIKMQLFKIEFSR